MTKFEKAQKKGYTEIYEIYFDLYFNSWDVTLFNGKNFCLITYKSIKLLPKEIIQSIAEEKIQINIVGRKLLKHNLHKFK